MVKCPICDRPVKTSAINDHIDSGCATHILEHGDATHSGGSSASSPPTGGTPKSNNSNNPPSSTQKRSAAAATFFQTSAAKHQAAATKKMQIPAVNGPNGTQTRLVSGLKRSFDEGPGNSSPSSAERTAYGGVNEQIRPDASEDDTTRPLPKQTKTNRAAPLAERMRPTTLDEVLGQEIVGPNGVLRALIDSGRPPSMILWGASGTGKTTIGRCVARKCGGRFVELNATSCGVADCKKIFAEAASELGLSGRRTVVFCDEIHRFSKAQQDVFLKPVENGTITLIGATTENPSFRVLSALLSRCRTFRLEPLPADDVLRILERAIRAETELEGLLPHALLDEGMLRYLAGFADGDARTALNLLELALSLTSQPSSSENPITEETIKTALVKSFTYDRAGDQHYDTISAFHKSVRGSDPDATLYYLARMLQSGEDPLFIARRMVVIASEDVGLADSSLLPLATATFTATQQIGLPEARIPLAHCATALALARKSVRAYRGLNNAFAALKEPGVAALPIPLNLRNAPTRLMKEMGWGAEYKYPPNYKDGRVKQEYLPEGMKGRRFLEDRDLGTEVDPEWVEEREWKEGERMKRARGECSGMPEEMGDIRSARRRENNLEEEVEDVGSSTWKAERERMREDMERFRQEKVPSPMEVTAEDEMNFGSAYGVGKAKRKRMKACDQEIRGTCGAAAPVYQKGEDGAKIKNEKMETDHVALEADGIASSTG